MNILKSRMTKQEKIQNEEEEDVTNKWKTEW